MSTLKRYTTNGWETVSGANAPQQPISFSANKNNVDQSLSGGVVTKLTFTNATQNVGKCYDSVNSKFQPTIAGNYLVSAQIRTGTTATVIYLYKNGVEVVYSSNGTSYQASIFQTIYLNGTTDYIEVYGYVGSGVNVLGYPSHTFFQASLIPDSYPTGSGAIISQGTAPTVPMDGQLWLDTSVGQVDTLAYVDLTLATTDYYLKRGEIAYLYFTNTLSVPLHIKAAEGIYEILVSAGSTTTPANDGNMCLNVLPTPSASSVRNQQMNGQVASVSTGDAYFNYFYTGLGQVSTCKIEVTTFTGNKSTIAHSFNKRTSGQWIQQYIFGKWDDITTPVTSLSSITFGVVHTGLVTIKRIF